MKLFGKKKKEYSTDAGVKVTEITLDDDSFVAAVPQATATSKEATFEAVSHGEKGGEVEFKFVSADAEMPKTAENDTIAAIEKTTDEGEIAQFETEQVADTTDSPQTSMEEIAAETLADLQQEDDEAVGQTEENAQTDSANFVENTAKTLQKGIIFDENRTDFDGNEPQLTADSDDFSDEESLDKDEDNSHIAPQTFDVAAETVEAAEIEPQNEVLPQAEQPFGADRLTAEEVFLSRIQAERITDVERAANTYAEVVAKVEEDGKARYAGSAEEKRAAKTIRDKFERELGECARMEPYDVYPFANTQGLPIFAAISVVAFVLSCVWSPLGVILFAAVALLIWTQVFKNKNDFSKLFPKRTSYNVVSVLENAGKRIEKTVVLGCHYDADYGRVELPKWISKQNNSGFHIVMICYSLGVNIFLAALSLACIFLKPGPKAAVMFVGFVALAVSVAYMGTYVTYIKLGSRMSKNALSGLGLTLAVAQHLKINKEELPSNVRVVIAAFGANYAGAKGSEAFLAEHYGKDNLLINPVFVDVHALRTNDCKLIATDKTLKLHYDGKLTETAFETFKEHGLNVEKVVEQGRYTDAANFLKTGIPSVIIDGGIAKESLFGETESDVVERYDAVLDFVRRVIKE